MLDHLALQQVVIGDISMGAAIALMLTLRYPERVRGLVSGCVRSCMRCAKGYAFRSL